MDRFWSKVDKGPDCWIWKGATSHNGYGHFWLEGKMRRCNRLVYVWKKGPIKPGLVVRHTCDNRSCVNPDHLILGTPADNSADMMKRDRWNGPGRSLSPAQVEEASKLRDQGCTYQYIGELLGVSRKTISNALQGLSCYGGSV